MSKQNEKEKKLKAALHDVLKQRTKRLKRLAGIEKQCPLHGSYMSGGSWKVLDGCPFCNAEKILK